MNSAIHIMGAISSRASVFIVAFIFSLRFDSSDFASYALDLGWANALASIAFLPLGIVIREQRAKGSDVSLLSLAIGVIFLFVVAIFVNIIFSRDIMILTISIFIVNILSYDAIGRNSILIYNGLFIISNVVYLGLVCFSSYGYSDYLDIYSTVSIVFAILYIIKMNLVKPKFLLMDGFTSIRSKLTTHIFPIGMQSILGLPILMIIQSVFNHYDDSGIIVSIIYLCTQVLNVLNIIIQRFNQIFVVKLHKLILDGENTQFKKEVLLYFWSVPVLQFILLSFVYSLSFFGFFDVFSGFWWQVLLLFILSVFNYYYWLTSELSNTLGYGMKVLKSSFVWGAMCLFISVVALSFFGVGFGVIIYAISFYFPRLVQMMMLGNPISYGDIKC